MNTEIIQLITERDHHKYKANNNIDKHVNIFERSLRKSMPMP